MLVLFGWSCTKNALEMWYWNMWMCCNFDVKTHMLGLTWKSRLRDQFYHILCISEMIGLFQTTWLQLWEEKAFLKSINANKDTICCNLDVQNICFLCFIKNTLKQKNQSSSNKWHLLNTEKLVTGYTDHFCTLWEKWKMLHVCWPCWRFTLQKRANNLIISIRQNKVLFSWNITACSPPVPISFWQYLLSWDVTFKESPWNSVDFIKPHNFLTPNFSQKEGFDT